MVSGDEGSCNYRRGGALRSRTFLKFENVNRGTKQNRRDWWRHTGYSAKARVRPDQILQSVNLK